jgi:hypothetical protein
VKTASSKQIVAWIVILVGAPIFLFLALGVMIVLGGAQNRKSTRAVTTIATPRIELPPPSATPDLSLLQITKHTLEKGGFDTVALWHITFWNRSDKPIGNIRYRTRYTAETGDQVDRGGVDALLGDYTIRKVILPHQKRTIEINDGFVNREAARGNFEIVSWEFVNPP